MRGFLLVLSVISCALGMSIRTHSTEVSFTLSATNLKGCGLILPCQTSVTILCSSIDSDWKVCDQTRKIRSNNPVWPKIFTFEHKVGTRQRWRLDLKEHNLLTSKLIASIMVNVDEYAEGDFELKEHPLPSQRGSLLIRRVGTSGPQ